MNLHPVRSLAFLLFSILITSSHAQKLERKGTFGVRMENAAEGKGIRVLDVIPQTTASDAGVQKDDLIVSVNGEAYDDVGPLVAAIGDWHKGDALTLQVKRGKSTKTLKAKVQGKPYETSAHGEVIYGDVDYDGGKLRSILEMPNDVDNPPVVMFVPGIGCGSLDYFYNPDATTKQLVEGLVAQGIAVYRVERSGMGDSEGSKDCFEMDYNYEIEACNVSLQKLKTLPGIDSNRIYLYGHSLGVITAPMVARQNKVAGIVAWGGISTTWFEYQLKIIRDQRTLLGNSFPETDEEFRSSLPFLYDFYVNRMTPQQLSENPAYAELMEYYFQGDLFLGMHHYSFFHTLNDVNILTAYQESNCPVLTLAGEFDLATIDTDWAAKIASAVNHIRPGTGESMIIPKTTHHYNTIPSMAVYLEMRHNHTLNQAYESKHFNHDVPTATGSWIKAQENRKGLVDNGESGGNR